MCKKPNLESPRGPKQIEALSYSLFSLYLNPVLPAGAILVDNRRKTLMKIRDSRQKWFSLK